MLTQSRKRLPVIGHADSCQARFVDLQQQVHAAACQTSCNQGAGRPDWQVLVRRFRSLRATLVSHADLSLFAARVYLLSTDVSLHAADHAEYLKSLQALVQQLLPSLNAQALQCKHECCRSNASRSNHVNLADAAADTRKATESEAHSSSASGSSETQVPTDWGWASHFTCFEASATPNSIEARECSASAAAVHDQHAANDKEAGTAALQSLWADCAGLLILYFTCIPRGRQGLELATICRGLPRHILCTAQVKQALQAYTALTTGDITQFRRLHKKAGWRQQRLMTIKLQQVQVYGLTTLTTSYRQLQCSDACSMLGLTQQDSSNELLCLLQVLQARGNHCAAAAVASLQSGKKQLVFRR